MPGVESPPPAKRRRVPAASVARRENEADVYRSILSATERLLADRRLSELTVVDVIEEAGVSRAAFYMYFESKHAAVAALADVVIEEIAERLWRPWMEG